MADMPEFESEMHRTAVAQLDQVAERLLEQITAPIDVAGRHLSLTASIGIALGSARPPVTATKSCTGHLLGAAGAVEALATVLSVRDGLVPPVRNLDDPDDAIDLDVVRFTPRQHAHTAALSTSFGFGGHDVSLVVTR